MTQGKSAHALKRCIDLAGAGTGLLLLAPLLLAISTALLASQGSPVFFRHVRPGRHGKPFQMVKFRTMRTPRAGEAMYGTDKDRLTRLGRFLRSTSLDELPELWNVLRGEMSLVGPRPLLEEYLDKYTPEERRRHDVVPGVTGWAAVNGRHALKFKERLALDVWYVDHWSLWLDLRILAMTLYQVLVRKDVAAVQSIEEIGFPLPALRPAGTARQGEPPRPGDEGAGAPGPGGAAKDPAGGAEAT
jgi:sugar transferase EpsL